MTWTHYRMLMRIQEPNRREFYLTESAESGWMSRQLERELIERRLVEDVKLIGL